MTVPTNLPSDLQQLIVQAQAVVRDHAQHELRPIFRLSIYHAIMATPSVYSQLAILTAYQVLPLWTRDCPAEPLAVQLLRLAEDIRLGIGDRSVAEQAVEDAWEQLTRFGADDGRVSKAGFFAGVAAREALLAVLSRDPFDAVLIRETTTDDDLDPWSSDPPHWAARAWTSDQQNPEPHAAKQHTFWEWRLTEAIPQAWQTSVS